MIVIRTKSDMASFARKCEGHPEIKYHTVAGENGTIVVILD
jgi:hypothetical protein